MADTNAGHRSRCRPEAGCHRQGELMLVKAVSSLLVLAVASSAAAQSWRTVDVSRQLLDTTDHRIRVKYAAGRFSMRPTSDPVLFSMQLRYDEDRSEPVHRYDADIRSATLG